MLRRLRQCHEGLECAYYQSPTTLLAISYHLHILQESVALLSTSPTAPNFAILDCENEPLLCNSWAAGPPSIYYMSIPRPLADQSSPAPTVRYIPLNRTSVTASDIVALSAKKTYQETEPYEGIWHPFNGLLAEYNLSLPIAYISWGLSKMPSWLPMIAISFLSRTFM